MTGRPSANDLVEAALEHFDAAAVALADGPWREAAWSAWFSAGCHADMGWLERTASLRARPDTAASGAFAWLIVARALRTEPPPLALWQDPRRGRVARYAWGLDYHLAMREPLARLAEAIRRAAGLTAPPRGFVDTAPVPEKELAARAGLGFVGRNTLVITDLDGSWFSLGGLALPWRPAGAAPYDPATAAHAADRGCGTCRRCRSACPTGALVEDRMLDARRCIAWATIECRGEIPETLRGRLHRWLAGCDLCQECCPWNGRRPDTRTPRTAFDPEQHAPLLVAALALSPDSFRKRYGSSAVARLGWTRWIRNALCAAATAPADADVRAAVRRHLDSPDAVVRATALWALRRLDAGSDEESDSP